jgi:hypothetical protein
LFLYRYCIYRNDCLNLPVVGFSQRKPSIPAFPTSFDLNLNKAPSVIFITIIGLVETVLGFSLNQTCKWYFKIKKFGNLFRLFFDANTKNG